MSKKETWSYGVNFNQPYTSFDEFFKGKSCREIYQDLETEEELDHLAKTDSLIDKMLTYPDAEAILNKIKEAK